MTVAPDGTLYFADTGNGRIRGSRPQPSPASSKTTLKARSDIAEFTRERHS
jgi:sugar lactone lactonase YvrE